ncbi:MAG: YeeE/YedE thiosulfate transporter family protein [Candidatus Omnitrophota bacterium]
MKKNIARHWPYILTGPVLAVLLITFWYFNQNYLGDKKNAVVLLLENPILTFGFIMLGAYISAHIFGEFSIKIPVTYEPMLYALAGGVIMGIGATIAAMSVYSIVLFNLAGIFNLTAFMVTKGWIYAVFMIAGGFFGSKLFRLLTLKTGRSQKEFYIPQELMEGKTQKVVFYAAIGIFAAFVAMIVLFSKLDVAGKAGFAFAVFFLAVFGVVVERGTICMSSMLKEWFLSSSSYVWRSILFTVMCLALLYQAGLKYSLFGPIEMEKYVSNAGLLMLGSFMMGFGFIFADGCFIGSLWKAGQGNIVNIAGILGMLFGIGVSQFIVMAARLTGAAGGSIPNRVDSVVPAAVFLAVLWGAGLLLLLVFKPKHYRY